MYNDTIDVSNKIITDSDLLEIFEKMNSEMYRIKQFADAEQARNANLDYQEQKWAYKFFSSTFKCTFNFYDSTTVTVDTYDAFLNLFNTRLQEIKDLWVRCHINYTNTINGYNSISNNISINAYENKMEIVSNLSSSDDTLDAVYELIKEKVKNAPERYDEVIKKKGSISNKIGFAIGMIPSLIICTLLAIIPLIRQIYGMSYVLYPVLTLLLAFLGGNTLFRGKIDQLYSYIEPEKKYMGYDTSKSRSVYADDINKFTSKSEILIGKNVNNLNIRKEIMDLSEKYSKFIPIEIGVLVVLSIIMIFIGKFVQ